MSLVPQKFEKLELEGALRPLVRMRMFELDIAINSEFTVYDDQGPVHHVIVQYRSMSDYFDFSVVKFRDDYDPDNPIQKKYEVKTRPNSDNAQLTVTRAFTFDDISVKGLMANAWVHRQTDLHIPTDDEITEFTQVFDDYQTFRNTI